MIDRIKAFFEQHLDTASADADPQHALQLGSAALMLEVTYADHEVSDVEQAALEKLLRDHFELNPEETSGLIELAHEEKHTATDYYRFTSMMNQHYTQEQKITLIEYLWRLAYADGVLDKLEEHLIRRLAGLLHVPHADFIQAKHRAEEDRQP